MPRHNVAIHCQWSTGAYASVIGMIEAKRSANVNEKPFGMRATGVLGAEISAGMLGGLVAETGEGQGTGFVAIFEGVGPGGGGEGSAASTVGEVSEAIGEGTLVINFIISTDCSCQD